MEHLVVIFPPFSSLPEVVVKLEAEVLQICQLIAGRIKGKIARE